MQTLKLTAALALTLGLSFSAGAGAQDLDKLPDYVPVLPQVKARALPVDPQKRYLVKEVKPNVLSLAKTRTRQLNPRRGPDRRCDRGCNRGKQTTIMFRVPPT